MSLVALPAELLDAIFAPLPPATLAALARTAAPLYPAAAARLYRALAASSFARNLAVVPTLAAHPHLAALVREFSLSLDDCDADAENGREYYEQLQRAVHGMHRLVSLELNVDARASWVLAPPASPSPSPSPSSEEPVYDRLESFACAFALDAPTAAFLARTPHLRALQLAADAAPSPSPSAAGANNAVTRTGTATATLAATALPRLASYTGPAHLLPQLLPARPLAALHLSGDLAPADVDALVHLSSSSSSSTPSSSSFSSSSQPTSHAHAHQPSALASIHTLSALTSAPPGALVAALAAACPAVVHLQVITTCALWEAPDVTSALCALPALKTFELSGMHWVLRPRHPSPPPPPPPPSSSASSSSSASNSSCPVAQGHTRLGSTHAIAQGKTEWLTPPPTPRAAPLALLEAQGPGAGVGMEDFAEAFMEWAY
ncbi:hypothetical protein EIP86_011249 [Pleurotus ostreatoroseus]|nr:hypothetical protein EIP86_011249 [Pleurotus ostreatoroseus]